MNTMIVTKKLCRLDTFSFTYIYNYKPTVGIGKVKN